MASPRAGIVVDGTKTIDPPRIGVYRAATGAKLVSHLSNPNEEHMGSSSFGAAIAATTGFAAPQTLWFVHDGHGVVRFGGRA